MTTRSAHSKTTSDSVFAAAEFEQEFDSLRTAQLGLYTQRQLLTHRRMSGEAIPRFREDYRGFRQAEEEIRLKIMGLENRWRVDPRVYPRFRNKECPKAARRLRRWLNLLIITILLAYFLLYFLGG